MKDFNDLIELSKTLKETTIVAANPADKASLEALEKASKTFPLKSILVGSKTKIEAILKECDISLLNYEIIDLEDLEEIAKKAVQIVDSGTANILMKGLIDTRTILKEVVNKETGIRTGKLLSHVTALEYPNHHKLLLASDCAMVTSPTYNQKIAIIDNLLELAFKLKIAKPKVAIISAVEKVNPKIESSVEASALKDYYSASQGFIVDGPFAVDNVVSLDAAEIKGIASPVAGDADALIFPNIDAGNVFYKTSVYLANATAAGIILGAKVPIVLTSRADGLLTKFYSILLAGVYINEI